MFLNALRLVFRIPGVRSEFRGAFPVRQFVYGVTHADRPMYRASFGSIGTDVYFPVVGSYTSGFTYPVGDTVAATGCALTPAFPFGLMSGRSDAPPSPSASAPLMTLNGMPLSKVVRPDTAQPPSTLP